MKTKTRELMQKLEKFAKERHANLYESVKTAKEILADKDWIVEKFAGDDFAARDDLQRKYFRDIHGFVELSKLLLILEMFPEEKDWAVEGYDLKALVTKYDMESDKNKVVTTRKSATLAQMEELQDEIKELQYSITREKQNCESRDEEISRLRDENANLKLKVAHLEGQLSAYTQKTVAA